MIYLLNGLILNYFCAVKLILQRFEKLYCFWYQDFFPKSTRISDIAHSGSKTRDQCTDCEIYPLFFSAPLALKPIIRFPSAHVRSSKPRGGYEEKEGRNESQRCDLLTLLLVPGLHEHHLFVFVPRSVGSVGSGDAPRPRGGWLDTSACPTAPATVLHNGGGTLLRPFAAALGSPQMLTTWSRSSFDAAHTTALYISFLFSSPLPLPFLGSWLYPRYSRSPLSRRFLRNISARSASVRETTPL